MAEGGDKPREEPLLIHLAKLKKRTFAIGELVFYRRTHEPHSWWPARIGNYEKEINLDQSSSGLNRFVYTLEGIGLSTNTILEELLMGADYVRPFLNEPEEVDDTERIKRWHEFDQIADIVRPAPPLMELFRRDLARGEARRLEKGSGSRSSAELPASPILLTDFRQGETLVPPLIALKEAGPTVEEKRAKYAGTYEYEKELEESAKKGTYEKPDLILSNESAEKKRVRFAQSHTRGESSPKKEETLTSSEADVSLELKKGDLVFLRLTSHRRSWWPAQVVSYGRNKRGVRYTMAYGLLGLGSMMKEENDRVPTDANMWRPFLNGPVRIVADDPSRVLHWHQFKYLANDPEVAPPLMDLFRRDVARGEAIRQQQDSSSRSSSSSSNAAPTVIPLSLRRFVGGITPYAWQGVPLLNPCEVIEIYEIPTPDILPAETLDPALVALERAGFVAQERRAKYASTVQEKAEGKPIEGAYEKPDLMISDESAEKKRNRCAQSHTRGQKIDLPPSRSAEYPQTHSMEETPSPDSSPVRYFRPDIPECSNLSSDIPPTTSHPKFQYSSPKKKGTLVSGKAAVKKSIGVLERGDLVFYQRSAAPNSWWPAQIQRCEYERVREERSPGKPVSPKLVYKLSSIGHKRWTSQDRVRGDRNEPRQFFNIPESVGADEISRIIPWHQFHSLATNSEAAPTSLDLFRRDLARGAALRRKPSSPKYSGSSSSSSSKAARAVQSSIFEGFIRGITPPAWENAPTTSHTEPSMPDGAERHAISNVRVPTEASVQLVQPHSASKESKPTPDLEKGTTPEVKNVCVSGTQVSHEEGKTPGSGNASVRKATESPGLTAATVSPKSRPPLPKREETTGSTVPTSAPGSQLSSLLKSIPSAEEAVSKISQLTLMPKIRSFIPTAEKYLEPSLSRLRESLSSGLSSTVTEAPPKSPPVTSKQTQRFTPDKSSPKPDLSISKTSELDAPTEKSKRIECETEGGKLGESARRFESCSYSRSRIPPEPTLPPSRDQQRTVEESLNRKGRGVPPVERQDSGALEEEANRASCNDKKTDDAEGSAQTQLPLLSDQQMVVDDSMDGHGRENPPVEIQASNVPKEEANTAGCHDKKADNVEGSAQTQPPLPSDQPMVVDSGNENDREPLPGEEQQLDTLEGETNVLGTGGHKVDIEVGESPSKK